MCADAGYTGTPALTVIEEHGYIPMSKDEGKKSKNASESLRRRPDAGWWK